ncbi:hypothetical protein [Methanoculleus taiwanensis]|uniref:hypothetical protein n=1 Tax=Methanoculleus taiwanensis TaxID=1550565 RepID=UPI0013E8DDFB|nr:hypothetical protein [Methanoculleus taiwanensis]
MKQREQTTNPGVPKAAFEENDSGSGLSRAGYERTGRVVQCPADCLADLPNAKQI